MKIKAIIFWGILFSFALLFYFKNSNNNYVDITSDSALIIAHRGTVNKYTENTIEAYEQSIKDGANWIEIDIRMTKDGVLVPMHDVDIDRTTTGTGKVRDLTWKQLSQFETVKNNHRTAIPSLEEVFMKFGKTTKYYLETRSVDGKLLVEQKLIALLKKHDLLDDERVIISSFETQNLKKIKKIEPSIPLLHLYNIEDFTLKDAVESNYDLIGLESNLVTKEVVKKLHEADKKVHVYFNMPLLEKNEQKRVYQFSVDGFITNDVRFTKTLLDR